MKGVFVTGTDTNVGKTYFAAMLAACLKNSGVNIGVMKPVETGCPAIDGTLTPQDAVALKEASGSNDAIELINPYRFKAPLSPSIAARHAGVRIDIDRIKTTYDELSSRHKFMIIEGAGGVMVPLNENAVTADLMKILGLPLIIVAASRLGVINQTLLTMEAAKVRCLPIKCLVLNHASPSDDESAKHNRAELERLLPGTPVFEIAYRENAENSSDIKKIAELF